MESLKNKAGKLRGNIREAKLIVLETWAFIFALVTPAIAIGLVWYHWEYLLANPLLVFQGVAGTTLTTLIGYGVKFYIGRSAEQPPD